MVFRFVSNTKDNTSSWQISTWDFTNKLVFRKVLLFNRTVKKLSALKLFDELILPFVLLAATRYFSIFIVHWLFSVQLSVGSKFDLLSLPLVSFKDPRDLPSVNSFSWLVTFVALAFFFGFILFRNLHFHENWIEPKVAARLHKKNLEFLITEAREALHQGASWSVITLISIIFVSTEFLNREVSTAIFGLAYAIGALLIIPFALEVVKDSLLNHEVEKKNDRKKPNYH